MIINISNSIELVTYNIHETSSKRIRRIYTQKLHRIYEELFDDDNFITFHEETLFRLGDPISIWVRQ